MLDINKNIALLRVPIALGARYGGTDFGPAAYDSLELLRQLEHAGFTVNDAGEVPCPGRDQVDSRTSDRLYAEEIRRICARVAKIVAESIQANLRPIVLGGDHSLNLGTFSGAAAAIQGQKIGMIYIDAHGDMNTPTSSPTANVHGMHVASLMGFGSDDLINTYYDGRKLDPKNLLHIAGSDLDQFEIDLIKQEGIPAYSITDILMHGLGPLGGMIDDLARRVDAVWVSFDLDAVNRNEAPGVGIPNSGGLTYREVVAIIKMITTKCNVIGADVVELNPPKDIDNKTAQLGIEVAIMLLGGHASAYDKYLDTVK